MNGGKIVDSIPNDLITEIHSRLSAKSVARFHYVSKLWRSMLRRPYFTELFLTRSCARPRLLLVLERDGEWSFFSSPPPQNPYKKTSIIVADFHMKFSKEMQPKFVNATSGLIFFSSMRISRKSEDTVPVICNPRTAQYAILPKLARYTIWHHFFGYDPIDKQIKVFFLDYPYNGDDDHIILTLGTTEKMLWRKIECSLVRFLYPWSNEICINGVLYYLATEDFEVDDKQPHVIVCFDVRNEKFKLLDGECFSEPIEWSLINYKGKLGGIHLGYAGGTPDMELCMWILEDVKKQEWSKHVYTLGGNVVVNPKNCFTISGVTATGEIVLSMTFTSKPFYVIYFNPKRNTIQIVEIQGLEDDSRVHAFVDLVEDLNVNGAMRVKPKASDQRYISLGKGKNHHN